MKIKVLSRNPDDYLRETKYDIKKIPRNYQKELHPFQEAREYTRALNAAKIERMFAKPFLGNLAGHSDAITCMAKHPKELSYIYSGAFDGEIKIWDLETKECIKSLSAHTGHVRGLTTSKLNDQSMLYSVGDDCTIKQWSLDPASQGELPLNTIVTKNDLKALDHNWKERVLATCGEVVELWDPQRTAPLFTLPGRGDTFHHIRFNPITTHLLAFAASDRSVSLFDIRQKSPPKMVIMALKTNAIAWNPMEAFHFTLANEDYKLYTFDLRNLAVALQVHDGHISAVLDVDYSPTGKEFVSGSYDKSIRIFNPTNGHSREIYHTKRMQRVTGVMWSMDNKYILTSSDEFNIRIWKAHASEKLGQVSYREQRSLEHNEKLKERFAHFPQVKRILRHRHVPKHIYNGAREMRAILAAKKRKEANYKAHSKPGTVSFKSERTKHILKEE